MNNIVWDDADITSLFSLNSSDMQYTYNDIRTTGEFEEGSGNFNAAPLMVDADNDDYNLTYESPCIDAGNPASTPDADSTVTDVGVYAYLHKADFTPLSVNSIMGTTINFTNSSVGHDDPNTIVSWDLNNDGTIESTSRDWSYQFNIPGIYDIKLIMTTGTLIDSLICEGAIAISDTLLKPPLNVELQISGDDALLDWDEVTETINGFPVSVQYYIIYKSDTANGVFEYMDYTDGATEFTDISATLSSEGFYFVIGFEGTFTQLQAFISTHSSYPPERSDSVPGKINKKMK